MLWHLLTEEVSSNNRKRAAAITLHSADQRLQHSNVLRSLVDDHDHIIRTYIGSMLRGRLM